MRQAGTQKRAPVQRRGPHAVRRRRSREQVNQTPEGETEDDVAGILRSGGKWEATQITPFQGSMQQRPGCPAKGGEWRAGPEAIGAVGGEDSGHPRADPISVPSQVCGCNRLGFLIRPEVMHLSNGEGSTWGSSRFLGHKEKMLQS